MSRLDNFKEEMNESASKKSTRSFLRNLTGKTNSRRGRPSGSIQYDSCGFKLLNKDWEAYLYLCQAKNVTVSEEIRRFMEEVVGEYKELIVYYIDNQEFGKYYEPSKWKTPMERVGMETHVIRISKELRYDFAIVCKCFGSNLACEIRKFIKEQLKQSHNKNILKSRVDQDEE